MTECKPVLYFEKLGQHVVNHNFWSR